jgi:long-chain acyl-CoA synthetase
MCGHRAPNPVLGEKLHVYIHAIDTTLDKTAVRVFIGTHLADYKVPDFATITGTPLPRNANRNIVKPILSDQV